MNRKQLIVFFPVLVILFSFTFMSGGGSSFGGQEARDGEQGSATDSILRLWLSPQTVNSEKPIANTFYFWTSDEELDSVLSQKRLLRTSAPSNRLEEIYWDRLLRTVKDFDPISGQLRSGDRQRIRAAWPCYWSILPESYSQSSENQLVQVVLDDSSLIVAFYPDRKRDKWDVYDLRGNLLSGAEALERKSHFAAVFITGKNKGGSAYDTNPRHMEITYVKEKEYYRTFILCNENMIKSWHHGVPGMQDKIIRDLDYLLLLNAYLGESLHAQMQGRKGKNTRLCWARSSTKMKIGQLVLACERFAWMTGYPATQKSTTTIIDLLRERWPKQVKPCERFPGKK